MQTPFRTPCTSTTSLSAPLFLQPTSLRLSRTTTHTSLTNAHGGTASALGGWGQVYRLARGALRGRFVKRLYTTLGYLINGRVGNLIIERKIGQGGEVGVVYLAKHAETGRLYAVKSITTLTSAKAHDVARQIDIVRGLRHEHIVKVVAIYKTLINTNLVMEYCEGGEMFDYLLVHSRMDEPLAWVVFHQLLSAVEYLHKKNICHRDLNLVNIFLDKNFNVKLGDFGFAAYQRDGELCAGACGTPEYVAPEVLLCSRYDGFSADVWSLGVILYTLIVGSYPFCPDGYEDLLTNIQQGRFPEPDRVSLQVRDLIRNGLLVVDVEQRFTLDKIKRHVWYRMPPAV
ncbi:uncharacterized protein VTP21DRAFT_7982 [Calcarisporiella thermophila]|uniref:uncharacterized protein n=1 Tax=Calcarisporiella thermophila TaxID=911321 RepID=UPI0037435162